MLEALKMDPAILVDSAVAFVELSVILSVFYDYLQGKITLFVSVVWWHWEQG